MTDIAEVRRREVSFLANLGGAQDDFEWLIDREAWLDLGHDSFAAWWDTRVQPMMRALSMRPTREVAATVVERVREEEAALPPAQRRTQRELADMVGMERSTLANRNGSRSARRDESHVSDLDGSPESTLDGSVVSTENEAPVQDVLGDQSQREPVATQVDTSSSSPSTDTPNVNASTAEALRQAIADAEARVEAAVERRQQYDRLHATLAGIPESDVDAILVATQPMVDLRRIIQACRDFCESLDGVDPVTAASADFDPAELVPVAAALTLLTTIHHALGVPA